MAADLNHPVNVIRFGAFEVNLQAGEVRKHGIRIRLQGQPIQILSMLLEHPGNVVTREEMRRRLWPADTFVEFEHSLNSAVKKLRQALSDSADHPLYIETLPRVGYRFIAPVEKETSSAHTTSSSTAAIAAAWVPDPATHKPRASPRWRVWILGLLALAAACFIAYASLSSPPAPRVIRFLQTSTSDRADAWAHFVTDGARVYFLEREGDHWNVVQTSTAGGETRVLPVPFRNTRFFDLSPDRSEFLIGSFLARHPGLPLWIWPVQGGAPVRVGDLMVDDAVWCPDGKEILFVQGSDIRSARRDGTGDRLLIHTSGNPSWLRWSPDGSRLSYSVGDNQYEDLTLWEASRDGSNAHLRFPDGNNPSRDCCGTWTPDGEYFLFTSFRNGTSNLWAVREKESLLHWGRTRPTQLTSAATSLWESLPVQNGTRVFAYGAGGDSGSVRYAVDSHQFLPFLPGTHLIDLGLSYDGNWVAIQVVPDWSLWRSRVDGTERIQLVGPPMKIAHPRWSPDGKRITFEGRLPGKQWRAYVVGADGGPIESVLSEEGEQSDPVWLPDGQSIGLTLNEDAAPGSSSPKGIYMVNLGTHQATKVPGTDNLASPLWSPDKKYLIAKTIDERNILLFDSSTEKWSVIASGALLSRPTWSHDSKFLYVQDILEAGEPIYRFHTGDFKRERILSFESLLSGGVLRCAFQDLARDGSLLVTLSRGGAHVYILDLDLP